MVIQVWDVGTEAGEDQALVGTHLGRAQQVQSLAEALGIAGAVGHAQQLAGIGVGPRMVGATEAEGVARLLPADGIGAVSTHVQQHVDLVFGPAGDDHRLGADASGDVVARVGYLALVGDIDPAVLEDVVQLLLKDVWVRVDIRMHSEVGGAFLHKVSNPRRFGLHVSCHVPLLLEPQIGGG